ncbi:hypothetical protein N8224_03090 [Gammaproteobacteria bacterium]|nr:hypothetical protein [Gammaproteobacteria bacterium]
MKKLLLITILIGGCATTDLIMTNENPLQRAGFCKAVNVGNYYGNCWVNRSESDPNFFKVIEALEMQSDFEIVATANKNLLEAIKNKKVLIKEANTSFDDAVYLFDNQKTFMINLRAEERAEKVAAFRRAMGNLSSQMKENSDAVGKDRTPIRTGQNRPLRSQTVLSDNRRSCVYGVGSNQKIFVTAVGRRCPSSM